MNKIQTKNQLIGAIIKGALIALCASLTLVLIFAFMLRFIAINDTAIVVVVQIIKGLSIVVGVLISMKNIKELGFVSGLIIAFVYTLISFVTFSILDNFTFEISKTLFNDLIFGTIIGGISGIIAVNLKKS